MIINQPNKKDFESVAIENLTQSFDLLFKVYDNYNQYDNGIIKEEVPIKDIWKFHSGTIRTSLILLQQGIEGLMKATICDISPLLLIDNPRKEWPTLPDSKNKDFDCLYMIGAEALLHTFCSIKKSSISITPSVIKFIEDVRQKRNRAIHGVCMVDVTPIDIIENILNTFTIWFGKDLWHKELVKNIMENPLFGYVDYEFEKYSSYKLLDFALFILGKNKLARFISSDIKGRSYFCPECKENIDGDFGTLESKWAFLKPNKPGSTIISCVNCQNEFEVIRNKCNNIKCKCKGNVLYDGEFSDGLICLTCYHEQ